MSVREPTYTQVEAFCLARVYGHTQIASYRIAYPDSKCSDTTAYNDASLVAKHTDVRTRLDELRSIHEMAAKEAAKEAGNAACVANSKERQEAMTTIMRNGIEEVDDGNLRDAKVAISASDQMNKVEGSYVQDENEGVTVIINQNIPGCDDE